MSAEIEITSEMLDAGAEAIRRCDYNYWETHYEEQLNNLASAVYRAMHAASKPHVVLYGPACYPPVAGES